MANKPRVKETQEVANPKVTNNDHQIKKEKILVITKETSVYSIPNLGSKYKSNTLTPGASFRIIDEVESSMFGKFYKIHTGEYVPESGYISIY